MTSKKALETIGELDLFEECSQFSHEPPLKKQYEEEYNILKELVEREPLIKLYQELTEINEVILLYQELGNNFLLKKLESLGGGKRKQELLKEIKELKVKINGSQD